MTDRIVTSIAAPASRPTEDHDAPRQPDLVVRSLPSLAAHINAEHDACCSAARTALDYARRCGELLIEARAQCEHGTWLPWLAQHCPTVSKSMAYGYIRIAERWADLEPHFQRVGSLAIRDALKALTARETDSDEPPQVATEKSVPIDELSTAAGWRYDDPVLVEKLATSLRRHGQLRPVVVREAPDGTVKVVDGRRLLAAMRSLGWERCRVAHVGTVDDESAARMQLDLELRAETDFAQLAMAVADLVERGASPASLAAASPFDEERIRDFVTLARWDWSLFSRGSHDLPSVEGGKARVPDSIETEYRCPSCAYEWSGKPKPFRAGGRAMADARDRRNGVRRLRLVYTEAEYAEMATQLRALQAAFGTAGMEATFKETLRRSYCQLRPPTQRQAT